MQLFPEVYHQKLILHCFRILLRRQAFHFCIMIIYSMILEPKDFSTGNGFNFSGSLITQNKDGSFNARNLIDSIKMEEDVDCVFFDADGDGDQDLLVTSGDVQFEENS